MGLKYRPEIDGLRAVAVLAVIFFHAGFPLFKGGFVGVDIFFVISGFLITSIIVKDLETGTFSFWEFYERRARRILPALFIVLLCCLPFAWLWMLPQELVDFSISVVDVCLFVSNILFWQQNGYFDTAAELKPLLHTWSLAVEEQFYIIFPIALLLMFRWGRTRAIWAIAALAAVSFGASEFASHHAQSFNFYFLPTRAWELMAGALCSFVTMKASPLRDTILSVGGLIAIAISIFGFDPTIPTPSLYALLPVLGTCAILLFARQETFAGAVLSVKPLSGIGLISYSAYLWHQPLFAFARLRSLTEPPWQVMLMLCVVSLALAYLSWRFVEVPARMRGIWPFPGRKAAFATLAVPAALFISAGMAARFAEGFPSRIMDGTKQALMATSVPSPKRKTCHKHDGEDLSPEAACEYFGKNVKLATFGDSHSVELAYALAEQIQPLGVALKQYSFSGCIPTFGQKLQGHYGDCSKWTQNSIQYISDQSNLTTVVVSYRINQALFGRADNPLESQERAHDGTSAEAVWASYIGVLNHLVSKGKHVVLVLQAPELPTTISRLIMLSEDNPSEIHGYSRRWWDDRTKFLRDHIAEIPQGVVIVDPANYLCDNTNCFATKDSVSYYFDDNHMSVSGARMVAQQIVPILRSNGWMNDDVDNSLISQVPTGITSP